MIVSKEHEIDIVIYVRCDGVGEKGECAIETNKNLVGSLKIIRFVEYNSLSAGDARIH